MKNSSKRKNFPYKEFSPRALVKLKQEKGLLVSVAIPTLNEEATIGNLLKTIQTNLMAKTCPLIDELLVIDSDSTDRTKEKVKARGVEFILSSQVCPEFKIKPTRGKGENLWKSLLVAKGDLVVWIDADVLEPHPAHVYGLLGPLLLNDKIKFTKAYFPRYTHASSKKSEKPNGGRVTEILVRPIFNLLFPELAHFYQPYNGNVAGRGDVLKNLEFPTGYSADLAILIDIVTRYGPDSIAQVSCPPFKQEGQSLQGLGKMGFQALRTIIYKACENNRLSLNKELPSIFKQPQITSSGNFEWVTENLAEIIRPPVSKLNSFSPDSPKAGFIPKLPAWFKSAEARMKQLKLKESLMDPFVLREKLGNLALR